MPPPGRSGKRLGYEVRPVDCTIGLPALRLPALPGECAEARLSYGRGAMTRVFSAMVAAGRASTAAMFACHHCSASSEVQVSAEAQAASAWSRSSALGGRCSGCLARQRMMSSARSGETGLPSRSAGGGGGSLTWRVEQAFDGIMVEERLAGEQPVADGAQRIEVAAGVNALRLFDRLRRHEVRRADDGIGLRAVRRPRAHRLHQPEVEDLHQVADTAPAGEDDVGGFDVAVDQADAMGLGERAADLAQDVDDAALGLGAELAHQLVEVDAAQVFHGEIEQALRGAAVVIDGDGVGMGELAGHLDLVLEAGGVGLVGQVGAEQLDGDRAAQQGMAGAVNHAVGAAADFLHEDVLAEPAGGEGALPGGGLQAIDQEREAKDGAAAGDEQTEEHQEDPPQDIEGLEGFINGLLGGDAHAVFVQPRPGADDLRGRDSCDSRARRSRCCPSWRRRPCG